MTAAFGDDGAFRGGAPRLMKIGTCFAVGLLQSRGFLRELRFLLPKRARVCIHGMVVPLLGRAFAVKSQRPQGCAFWRTGWFNSRTTRMRSRSIRSSRPFQSQTSKL